MPSNKQRLIGAVASIGITVGGAWLASTVHTNSSTTPQVSFPDGLTVSISGVRNSVGNVVIIVFSDRDAFKAYDAENAAGYLEIPASRGTVEASFPDLKTGPYAVVAFHDEDKNQDLNTNGEWPSEGYATSGASDAYDTPTFRKATISQATSVVKMYYPD